MHTYDLTIASFIRSLSALSSILEKAKAYADTKKIDFSVLLQTRLAPDQFPLAKQLQITTDVAKALVPRLTPINALTLTDTETTYEEFQDRISSVVSYLRTVKPEDLENFSGKQITFPFYPGKFLSADDYIPQYALPNFYFHLTTAYSILRSCGVELGKSDFLAGLSWQAL